MKIPLRKLCCGSALLGVLFASGAQAQAEGLVLLPMSLTSEGIKWSVNHPPQGDAAGGVTYSKDYLTYCGDDDDCPPRYSCHLPTTEECPAPYTCDGVQLRCVVRRGALPGANTLACVSDDGCKVGNRCDGGVCVAVPGFTAPRPPESPPPVRQMPSPTRSRGLETYLFERAVPLREQLALGDGPLIALLATTQGVPTVTLGRALRSHRAELVELMGDAAGTEWTGRFLARVEELGRACERT